MIQSLLENKNYYFLPSFLLDGSINRYFNMFFFKKYDSI